MTTIGKEELFSAQGVLEKMSEDGHDDFSSEETSRVMDTVFSFLDLDEEGMMEWVEENANLFPVLLPAHIKLRAGLLLGLHVGMIVERQRNVLTAKETTK